MRGAEGFFLDQSGAISVLIALSIVVLLGMGALAIDVGHLSVVKSELQKAADAGALAGARGLVPYDNVSLPPQPNWLEGQTRATQTVRENKADGKPLTDCQVQSGYWSFATKTLQSTGILPTSADVPAIKVTIAKTVGKNGGPVQMLFGPILGKRFSDVSAQALAFISGISGIPAHGGGFPLAVPLALVDQYWFLDSPVSFKIGSTYHNPVGGQWTSFKVDSNNVPTIRDLIANGNPDPLKIGDDIWIQPGTKDTLFKDAASKIKHIVILPVVTTDFATHSYTPILGFVSFYIEDSVGGSGKYVLGHIVKGHALVAANPGGPYFGTFIPPKLTF